MCNYYVGKKQIVIGDWGEGRTTPYRRLWDWHGESFKSHEPPILDGNNGPGILIPIKFNHYAYYFESDIKFKEDYYSYYGLYDRWLEVQKNEGIIPVEKLLGPRVWWSKTNTVIKKV